MSSVERKSLIDSSQRISSIIKGQPLKPAVPQQRNSLAHSLGTRRRKRRMYGWSGCNHLLQVAPLSGQRNECIWIKQASRKVTGTGTRSLKEACIAVSWCKSIVPPYSTNQLTFTGSKQRLPLTAKQTASSYQSPEVRKNVSFPFSVRVLHVPTRRLKMSRFGRLQVQLSTLRMSG